MEHEFTSTLKQILAQDHGEAADEIFAESLLLQYLNIKTKSANRGSKARSSFANLYAVYVLVEDYIAKGFHQKQGYADYEGAMFTDLFKRQRVLPFGQKLQNHALNHRMNEEFRRYFPTSDYIPILRDLQTNRYWVNENLLRVRIGQQTYNLAQAVLHVIEAYIAAKKDAFERLMRFCENAQHLSMQAQVEFIGSLIAPNADARIFEIVSFSVLKYHYEQQQVYWGYELDQIRAENLQLFKTGRTNANDGGI